VIRYAIVPSRGCYGSGERVRAVRVCRALDTAIQSAARLTASYRRSMARHGGSSGGYRVVETEARTSATASWYGHVLDRKPSAVRP
jgi:hypothetical protein